MKSLHFTKFCIIALMTCSFPAFSKVTCSKGKIRSLINGEKHEYKLSYCYEDNLANIYSPKCKNQNCVLFKDPRRFSYKEFMVPIGTPGFELCREIGGTPEVIEFLAQGQYQETDRCNMGEEFVDTDTLMGYYIVRAKKLP